MDLIFIWLGYALWLLGVLKLAALRLIEIVLNWKIVGKRFAFKAIDNLRPDGNAAR